MSKNPDKELENDNLKAGADNKEGSAVPVKEKQSKTKKTREEKKKGKESPVSDDLLAKIKDESTSLKDQLLRKQADFDNFRKRMFRERDDAIRYANSSLISDLVDIIDNFERALKSADESEDFSAFKEGIVLIEEQFTGMLERKWGLKRFESAGEEFDPQKHEAILMEESEEYEEPVVLEDYQKGYMLHDRILRHAKVKVAKPKEKPSSDGDTMEDCEEETQSVGQNIKDSDNFSSKNKGDV